MALLVPTLLAFPVPANTFSRNKKPAVACTKQPAWVMSNGATPTSITRNALLELSPGKPAITLHEPSTPAVVESSDDASLSLNRNSFPPDFLFGTAAASYQYEGAAKEGGRGPSIWDIFTNRYPGGSLRGGINQKGVEFYNDLINEIIAHGLQPFVTIFHWDLPHALYDEYGGFLSSRIVDDFRDYSELCFRLFGDRVKHWITLNEPWSFCKFGYDTGTHAPGRCSKWVSEVCEAGDSSTEPYVVAHNQLLSHAAAVKVYKEKYQEIQKGQIGITIVTEWIEPYNEKNPDDVDAAQRALDFYFGWYMDPIVFGDYPECMKNLVRERLPRFTPEQSEMLKRSYDFIGLNYYTAKYAKNVPTGSESKNLRYSTDSLADLTSERDGVPIGPLYNSSWVHNYPRGLRELLKYTKEHYNNPTIYITENGTEDAKECNLTLKQTLGDDMRMDYHRQHLLALKTAIQDDEVDVKGYFVWSFLDNFEWASGYTSRFGLYYIDYDNDLTRYPKLSALWFRTFLNAEN